MCKYINIYIFKIIYYLAHEILEILPEALPIYYIHFGHKTLCQQCSFF